MNYDTLSPRLRQICRGESELPPHKVEQYRALFRRQVAEVADSPTPSPHRQQPLPSLLQRALNFGQSLTQHVAAGMPVASQEVIEQRFQICQGCEQFDGQHCRVCGCRCGGQRSFFNKLARADQACPHPDGPKWTAALSPRDPAQQSPRTSEV